MFAFDWLNDVGSAAPPVVFDVLEVAFKGGRRDYFSNLHGLDLQTGDAVVVDADRGHDFGTVHLVGEMVRLRLRTKGIEPTGEFPSVLRRASLDDLAQHEVMRERDTETFMIGRRTIDRMSLPMKLVDVEWQLDERKDKAL